MTQHNLAQPDAPDAISPDADAPRVLVTGASGYIGGRLVPRLLDAGYRVRCFVRNTRKLQQRPWSDRAGIEVVQGDVNDTRALTDAMTGCAAGYYLIHSMVAAGDDYAERDRALARSFAKAAADADMPRIIYLGGLGEMGPNLSAHLRSRREVEAVLNEGSVPVTTFRAAMIIGSGSASFEILRYLVERLPVMITPKWVRTESQPIAIADVLHYLVRCLDTPDTTGRTLEIGGSEVRTYRELMDIMARELGLMKRLVIPVPVLTPKLSSLWIGLVTPVSPRIGRPLAEGLKNRVIVNNADVRELMPHEPMSPEQAIRRALKKIRLGEIETRWSAAGVIPGDPDWAGGALREDVRSIDIDAKPEHVFAAVCRVGGGHGWYAADILWRIRGWMDQFVGGPGLRRGRRHPETVEYGEALDFWRVIDVQPAKRLALLAEMKLPGEAGLAFDIEPIPSGGDAPAANANATAPSNTDADASSDAAPPRSRLTMSARFRPKGLLGLAYWYAVLPAHFIVFRGMLAGMRRAAEHIAAGETAEPVSPPVAPPIAPEATPEDRGEPAKA